MAGISSPEKICVTCGQDVAGLKRFKDSAGNYYCAPCHAARQQAPSPAALGAAAVCAPPSTAPRTPSVNIYQSGATAAVSRPGQAGLADRYCPSCEKHLPPGTKICIPCGINIKTGRPLRTAQGLDADVLEDKARGILRWVSVFVPVGLYPIASEAYGGCKPFVVWAITVITIIASTAFWVADYDNNTGGDESPNKYLLWCGPQVPEGQSELTVSFRDKSTGQVEEVAIPTAHFGHFHWYQLITHAFLHAGLMHIVGNLLFLLVLGSRVNALLGQVKTLILYPLLAVASGGAQMLFTHYIIPTPSLGASGAIMGLVGMYLVLFPVHKVYMTFWLRISWRFSPWVKVWALRGFWVPLFYIAFDVVATLRSSQDHVAHWAHLGGFIAGVTIASARC